VIERRDDLPYPTPVEIIAACLFGLAAVWRAHVAGAAYAVAGPGKPPRGAIAASLMSVVLVFLAIWLAR
jgi:hypothetical protein